MNSKRRESKKILGVKVDFGLDMDEVVRLIDKELAEGNEQHLIATTSPYFIMAAQDDLEFRSILNKSFLSIPDGIGVLYANCYLNKIEKMKRDILFPLRSFYTGVITGLYDGYFHKEQLGFQLTGVELTERLMGLAESNGYNVFILGGRRRDTRGNQLDDGNYDMATEAAKIIKMRYPKIKIVGATSKYSRHPSDDNDTLLYIRKCMQQKGVGRIDILLVAYNPVGQEKWIHRNANVIPATISVGIGRTLDYITDEMSKPPNIYERMNIGWLYPLIIQPWRIKRVLMSFPTFPIKVYRKTLKE